ncbi:class I SAM-dependent RNA methyltransferase [Deferribacter abyssi]|uniref:class I SAM-dependent RNA methyltransferase n=1 Tax=Deferribacter abyssi TaxID=213806 RepID=UPI003C2503A5
MKIYNNIPIIDTAYGGYGVAKIEGSYTVFIPFTVEGDIVDFQITTQKKTHAFGKLLQIKEKSYHRKEIACPYLFQCGGCLFGHIDYGSQLTIKEKIVKNFFRRISNFKIDEIISSFPDRYRFRATFRILKNKSGFLGFKSNRFIQVENCLICKTSMIEKIKEFLRFANSDAPTKCYIIENEEGEALINFEGKIKKDSIEIENVVGIKTRNKIFGQEKIKISVDDIFYYCGFDSFSQSNRYLLGNFLCYSTKFLKKNDRVLELYSGSGFFTNTISRKTESVTAVEENFEATKLLKELNLNNLNVFTEKVEKLQQSILKNHNILFVDPPRSGLSKNVIKLALNHPFEKIIYVSCNPATMARDISNLIDKYQLENFYIIDMFPNTYHIESIAYLTLR